MRPADRRPTLRAVSTALVSTLLATRAHGDELTAAEPPAIPEQRMQELFIGELAFPERAWELQVTGRADWSRPGAEHLVSAAAVVELGLTDRLQLGLELPATLTAIDGSTGLSRLRIASLYNVYRARGALVSSGLELGVPVALDGDASYETELFVSLFWQLGPVGLALSGGPELQLAAGAGEGSALGGSAAVAIVAPIRSGVSAAVELGWEHDDGASRVDAAVSLTLACTPRVEAALAVLATQGGADRAYGLAGMVTFELGDDDDIDRPPIAEAAR